MKKKQLYYRIVLEGRYDLDPTFYDTDDVNEIAKAEREWVTHGVADFIDQYGLEPVEVIIRPVNQKGL